MGQLAVGDVEVGPANAAGADPDLRLSRAGNRHSDVPRLERFPRPDEHHRAHAAEYPFSSSLSRAPLDSARGERTRYGLAVGWPESFQPLSPSASTATSV